VYVIDSIALIYDLDDDDDDYRYKAQKVGDGLCNSEDQYETNYVSSM
jgi:hypothetical protein